MSVEKKGLLRLTSGADGDLCRFWENELVADISKSGLGSEYWRYSVTSVAVFANAGHSRPERQRRGGSHASAPPYGAETRSRYLCAGVTEVEFRDGIIKQSWGVTKFI